MNERYLYKGKALNDSEWRIGTLLVDGNGHHIVRMDGDWFASQGWHPSNTARVDPATIGQCTGLSAEKSYRGTNSEDLLIFEGDIVKTSKNGNVVLVIWCKDMLCWTGIHAEYSGIYKISSCSEVIGNIHDSPGLLTGGQSTPPGEGILTEKKAKGKNARKKFEPPTLEQIRAYCQERNNDVDPQKFFDFFNESGWIDSRGNPVRNWKQKVITWEGRGFPKTPPAAQAKPKQNRFVNFNQREKDYTEIEKLERAYLEQKYGSG